MGGRRHWLQAVFLTLLAIGIHAQHHKDLGRFVEWRISMKQHPRGLERYRATMLDQMHDMSTGPRLSEDLLFKYLRATDVMMEFPSSLINVTTHNPHQFARGLRQRHKRKWSEAGKGGKGGELWKDDKRSHFGHGSSKKWKHQRPSKILKDGKEASKSSKKSSAYHDKTPYGYEKAHAIGYFYKQKYHSSTSKSNKGKGKGKSKKRSKTRSAITKSKTVDSVCSGLDFRGGGSSVQGKGTGGGWEKGKGKRRELHGMERSLQYGGELCKLNVLDVASSIAELSIFMELITAADLQDIFLCAGKKSIVHRKRVFQAISHALLIFATGPFTLLVPSNDALNANPALLSSLFNPLNMLVLQQTLLYHILPGFYESSHFRAGPLRTLLGADIDVSRGPLKFDQAVPTETDILACNGAINIIDDLLIPPGKSRKKVY